MGIYDREYYRDGSGGPAWLAGFHSATKVLVAINVAVFLAVWVDESDRLLSWLWLSPGELFRGGQVWRLITSAFLHRDGWHLLFNMLLFWFVGKEVEAIYGRRETWLIYLTGAVVSGLIWAAIEAGSGGMGISTWGASGAVWAIVAIFTLYYPNREILLFGILPLPMWVLAVLFLGGDLLGLLQNVRGEATAPIAFAGHLGGAAYGALYKQFDLRWGRLLAGISRARRPRFRIVRPDSFEETEIEYPVPSAASKSVTASSASRPSPSLIQAQAEEFLEARVDEILAKIAREGRGSLTEDEQRVLQEASKRARAKRSERLH